MSSRQRGAPRHTGLAIAGIAAIPFASVTAAAWLGDAASSTDPREAFAGAIALVGGLLMGLLVRRLVATVDRHVRGVVQLVAATLSRLPGVIVDRVDVVTRLVFEAGPTPSLVFVPSDVGRRGPPIHVR